MSDDLTGSPYDFEPETSRGCCLGGVVSIALSLALFAVVYGMVLLACIALINLAFL